MTIARQNYVPLNHQHPLNHQQESSSKNMRIAVWNSPSDSLDGPGAVSTFMCEILTATPLPSCNFVIQTAQQSDVNARCVPTFESARFFCRYVSWRLNQEAPARRLTWVKFASLARYFVSNVIASCAQPDEGGPCEAVSGR